MATVFLPLVAIGLLAVTVSNSDSGAPVIGVVVAGAGLATVLAYLSVRMALALGVSRSIEAMTERARAITVGHLGAAPPLQAAGPREIVQLVDAFNAMFDRVRSYVDDLEASQLEFRRAVGRVGDTLLATHDRQAIIEVVIETALLVSGGRVAAFYAPRGGGLVARVVRGADPTEWRVGRGEGLAGSLHDGMEGVVFPGTGTAALAAAEPAVDTAMAVPVRTRGRLFGVLAVYGRDGERGGFDEDDLGTLGTLARQAEAAIENTFLHEEAARLSITDGLTGVWNRRHFDLRAVQELDRAVRFREPFAVLFADLDDFKQINDTYGHQTGDAVLVELSRRFKANTREVDLVARYGGEEFVLLLPRTEADGAVALAEKLREAVCDAPFATEARPLPVSISIGVAAYPECADSLAALVAAADEALYRAKAAGKNRVQRAPRAGG